jgi:hypothetical protein
LVLATPQVHFLPRDFHFLLFRCFPQFVLRSELRTLFLIPECTQPELVRLYDLQCAIAELTSEDAHYVKRLDPPSWGRFLQILEDTVPGRLPFADLDGVGVLYSTAAQNVTTRAAMKSLLTASDPGGVVTVDGTLNSIARDQLKCHNCGSLGHFTRDCPLPRVHLGAGLNVIGVQVEQHENDLIATLRFGARLISSTSF